jgi:lipopolysaccharide/colanic/teichoic acid biosynthesis glycosyltransferase
MQSQSSELEHTIPRQARVAVVPSARSRRVHHWLKNVLDLAIAVVTMVVLWPVLLIVGLAVKLDSPGPAIFKQKRIGKDGKVFTVRKFRSMYLNADDRLHREALQKLVQGEPAAKANGQTFFKPADDPRVTRVGKFLRATGLDELPQVINILQRDMSVVGPRPAIPYELELYKDWHHRRLAVRPGVTGLWQVRRHDTENFDDVMKLDLEYIDSFSIWLDLKIILLTFPMILFRRWTF